MPNATPAQLNAEAALHAQAKRTAISLVKLRARAYARRPLTLENSLPGLTTAEPETMIAFAKQLIEAERGKPRRWFGFGGEVPLLNAKAVLLLARARRRAARARAEPAKPNSQGLAPTRKAIS